MNGASEVLFCQRRTGLVYRFRNRTAHFAHGHAQRLSGRLDQQGTSVRRQCQRSAPGAIGPKIITAAISIGIVLGIKAITSHTFRSLRR